MANDIRLDTRKLEALERAMPGTTSQVLRKTMLDAQRDMADNFSTDSPSAPGQPPGVDTGALKNSLAVSQAGPMRWQITGIEYGLPLEYGVLTRGLLPRPFIIPALMRAIGRMPAEFRVAISRMR